ncbi:MAG: hypothetical protein Q8M16_03270 [Pirellulaceae bacterium]|nr:hypothetical protein [Pirellulaceae bacterium]
MAELSCDWVEWPVDDTLVANPNSRIEMDAKTTTWPILTIDYPAGKRPAHVLVGFPRQEYSSEMRMTR